MPSLYETEVGLGQAMLGHAQLGDARRTARLVTTFHAMCRHPGGTLPDKLPSPADLKAFYRLCDCEDVTHAALIAAARQYTLARIAAYGKPVLVLHDATELDYTSLESLAGELGQIGKGHGRGYECHNVLAVAEETGEVLGLLDQILHHRDEVPEHESLAEHRNRETRESLLWLRGTEHLPPETQLIDVADQGASTFEFLEHEFKSGRRFVIRDGRIRKVSPGHAPAAHATAYLKDHAQGVEELGRFTMDVQAQRGRKARKEAEFVIRGGALLVWPPHAKHGHHGNQPLPLWFVLVTEMKPPPGEDPIEWLLLTNEPVEGLEDAWRVITWYERRWIVEEFHKAKKTGCQNRKSDHHPGWLVLWRGWTKLQAMLDGYEVAKRKKCG